jgi:hypothetical protein
MKQPYIHILTLSILIAACSVMSACNPGRDSNASTQSAVSTPSEPKPIPAATLQGIEQAAAKLTSALGGNEQVNKLTGNLLSSLGKSQYANAAKSLSSLAQLDFSKESLPAYASLLGLAAPTLISQVFETTGENANPMAIKAIDFVKKNDLGALVRELTTMLETGNLSSLQSGVISDLVQSYAPVIAGFDTKNLIKAGESLLGK